MIYEQAIAALADAGAVIVDPADPPDVNEFFDDPSETIVLVYEFKRDLNAYLATRTGVPIRNMADLIQFNLDTRTRSSSSSARSGASSPRRTSSPRPTS